MSIASIVILIAGAAVGGLGVWLFLRSRLRGEEKTSEIPVQIRREIASADALILGEPEHPFVEITSISIPDRKAKPLELDSGLTAALQPLLQRAPEILKTGSDMSGKTLHIVFSPAVTRGLNSGALELVETRCGLLAVARDAGTGRFVERGMAVVERGVGVANVVALGWQIAAIATAQHYLPEINERLRCLEDRVDKIHFFQHEEKRAELRAAIHLLRQYHDALARGQLHAEETTAIFKKLEDLEHECLAIGELARELARHELEELETLNIREELDRSGSAKRAALWVQQNRELLELIFYAQSCRVLGCQVKAALPGDRALLRHRIEHARDEVHHAVEALKRVKNRYVTKAVRPLGPRTPKRQPSWIDFIPYSIARLDLLWKLRGIFDTDYRPQLRNEFRKANSVADEISHQLDTQIAEACQFAARFDQLANSGLALNVRLDKQGAVEILSAGPA